jgi:hypothetical protein
LWNSEVLGILLRALPVTPPDAREPRVLRVLKRRRQPPLTMMAEAKNSVTDHSAYRIPFSQERRCRES